MLFFLIVAAGCSPTAKLVKQHDFATLVDGTIEKLAINPEDRKAQQKLQNVYREALNYFQQELSRTRQNSDSISWTEVAELMDDANSLAGKIKTSSAALRLIPNPKVFSSEFDEARKNAIEELTVKGKLLLNAGGKQNARDAYFLFVKASALVPDSEDISQLMNDARRAATYYVVVNPILLSFNTLKVATQKIDKEFFYWTQRDVSSRPFVRYYTADEANNNGIEPDFVVQISILDYRVDKMAGQSGAGTSNLMASGTVQIRIYSSSDQELVFRKNIACRYDSQTKSTITVNTIDLQRVVDPDIQTFFDYMVLSDFQILINEIEGYFSTLVKR
jgi:hypothetical protein